MTETKIITEKEVRRIAREESLKIITKELTQIKKELKKQGEILARLDRVLLGELGAEKDETLKWRANFAYQQAMSIKNSKVLERIEPMLALFEDWNLVEKGEKESKLESLGKMIVTYRNIRWLLAILGVTTLLNALPVLSEIAQWFANLGI